MTFKPGQSGNPGGRPKKGLSFAEALRTVLRERDPATKRQRIHDLARVVVDRALAGDMAAIEFIANRVDGKVPDQVSGQQEIVIRVVYDDDRADGQPAALAPGPAPGDQPGQPV